MLVADTKPRFIAQKELSGFSTKLTGRYRKWGIGSDVFPDSFVLPVEQHIKSSLDRVWQLHGTTAIATAESENQWGFVSEAVTHFYEDYGAKIPRLVFVDELSDFYKYRSMGEIFMRIARNGRERNVALIACSQRPRKIPTEVMSEMKRLYMFELPYEQDVKHVYEFGIPKDVQIPLNHTFYMYDRHMRDKFPSNAYHVLNLIK